MPLVLIPPIFRALHKKDFISITKAHFILNLILNPLRRKKKKYNNNLNDKIYYVYYIVFQYFGRYKYTGIYK